ncbi:hypothetical protein QJS10_CPA08g01139 [Acorus calamus]|uniref:Rhomboid-like protein n=1 Tax=Acorus calamus TaxID=4465 RepID=A0AAV9ED11_ACOCL|nr:hypothetical protein QJS10_CPA08g01139 [Acorus calamus]
MEAKKTLRDHLRISIASPPPHTPPDDGGVDGGSSPSPAKVPFFGPKRSRGKENTWVVSLFVVLSVVAFFATIFVNDCPSDPPGNCFFASLGRLSFQPLSENPLIGPSSST